MKIAITGTGGTGSIGHVLHKLKSIGICKDMIVYDKTIPFEDVKEIEVPALDSMIKSSSPEDELDNFLNTASRLRDECSQMEYKNFCDKKLKSLKEHFRKPRKRKMKSVGGLGNTGYENIHSVQRLKKGK